MANKIRLRNQEQNERENTIIHVDNKRKQMFECWELLGRFDEQRDQQSVQYSKLYAVGPICKQPFIISYSFQSSWDITWMFYKNEESA